MLSALLEIDQQGESWRRSLRAGVIRSAERMTYTNVHRCSKATRLCGSAMPRWWPRFELMQELALILNRKRTKRGSIDFDLPETADRVRRIRADDRRDPRARATSRTASSKSSCWRPTKPWPRISNSAGIPSIYRIHEQPDPKRVMEFEEIAAHFGYSLGVGAIPVKRFAIADKRRDGAKGAQGRGHRRMRASTISLAQLSEADCARSKASRKSGS